MSTEGGWPLVPCRFWSLAGNGGEEVSLNFAAMCLLSSEGPLAEVRVEENYLGRGFLLCRERKLWTGRYSAFAKYKYFNALSFLVSEVIKFEKPFSNYSEMIRLRH